MTKQVNKRRIILHWYLLQGIVLIICFFCVRYGKHELKSPIDSLVIGSILSVSSIIGLYTNRKWVVFVDFVMILYSIFFALFCFLLVAVASPMLFFAIILILLSVINIIAAVYLVSQILIRNYSIEQ